MLQHSTLRHIPDVARDDGLSAFLLDLASYVASDQSLLIEDIAKRVWQRPINPSSVSSRFIRLGLGSPKQWLTCYRAAAAGVLLSEEVDIASIAAALSFDSATHIYHIIRVANPAIYQGDVLSVLRRRSPDYGFRLFVKPCLPRRQHSSWRARLEPATERRTK